MQILRPVILLAILLTFAVPCAAAFSELELVRVVYHYNGSVEVASSLGNVRELVAQNNATVGGGNKAFALAQFPGADWADLFVAYFAVDSEQLDAWTSGPLEGQTSGNREFGPFKSATTFVYSYYNTFETSGAVVAQQSYPNSYWTIMDSSGISRGGFKTFIPAMNGEANLAALKKASGGAGYVDQPLYFYDNPNTVAPGVAVATLRTTADGTTIVNPQTSLPQVHLSVTDARATEGTPVKDKAKFRIVRSGDVATPLVVRLKFSGSAKNGVDYKKLGGKLTIPANADSREVTVIPLDDSDVEGTETLIVAILPDAAYELGSPLTGTIEILDDEPNLPVVTLKLIDGIATEGTPVTDKGKLQIKRTGDLTEPLTVTIAAGGTATPKADYKKLANSLTLGAGKASQDIVITPVDDLKKEGVETVIVTLQESPAYLVGTPAEQAVSIYDND